MILMNKPNNLILYVTSFLSGMTVMAVELACSRLLAPYFSSSQIVWTIIIGLIMISMSIGNMLGADWRTSIKASTACISISDSLLWITAILLGYPISGIIGLLLLFPRPVRCAGSTLSCLIIFALPMALLGMVSPIWPGWAYTIWKTAERSR